MIKNFIFKYLLFIWCIAYGRTHREEECVEVGFARASFGTVEQGYLAAKEHLIPIWRREDQTGSPSFRQFNPQIKNVTRAAHLLELASKNILATIRKTRVGKRCPEVWLLKGIEKHVSPLVNLDKELADEIGLIMSFRCLVGSPYPNVDGTCNHEQAPDQGAIGSKLLRLLPPVAGTGGFAFRESAHNEKRMPSARSVAQLIRKHLKRPPVTSLFSEVSHFLALDSVDLPDHSSVEDVDCCERADELECSPIHVDKDDSLHKKIKCINYRRSSPAQAILGHRDFLTMVSTYLDANPVYGSTNDEAFEKKEGYFGFLKYPHSTEDVTKRNCEFPKSFSGCFGLDAKNDKNFVENFRLLLTLEHNYISEKLADINPHFDDSLLYNEARRIVIAQYDAIVYGEFIPLLMGEELARKHSLLPGSEGPGSHYIPEVNPGILNSYALATYRNPAMEHEWDRNRGFSEALLARQYDGVRNSEYVDFLAMDIQKGRDHALASYSAWRGFCDGGKSINSWEDAEEIFSKDISDDLKKLYQEELGDLDLLVALLEPSEEDAIHGKTFNCIAVDQYARLKTGNRLFWEFDTSMLTKEQRDAIRTQTSVAALLCRHMGLKKILQNPFLNKGGNNPEVDCASITDLDLSLWKDIAPQMKQVENIPEEPVHEQVEVSSPQESKESDESDVVIDTETAAIEGGTDPLPDYKVRSVPKKAKESPESQKKQEL